MHDTIFQKIYETISGVIHEDWTKIIYRADYANGSWGMIFYIATNEGLIKDCYSLHGISQAKLLDVFSSLNSQIKEWQTKEKWSVMTISISSDGKFKTDFDYNSISENVIDYYKKWENKYLH